MTEQVPVIKNGTILYVSLVEKPLHPSWTIESVEEENE